MGLLDRFLQKEENFDTLIGKVNEFKTTLEKVMYLGNKEEAIIEETIVNITKQAEDDIAKIQANLKEDVNTHQQRHGQIVSARTFAEGILKAFDSSTPKSNQKSKAN